MGRIESLMNFGKQRKGKIITWSLIGGGLVFLLIGLFTVIFVPGATNPKSISLPGMKYVDTGAQIGYHLEITDPTTNILTKATPANANSPISFSTEQKHLIDITPKVTAGGTAVITLKREAGFYKLSKELITIQVTSSTVNTVIYAKIVITQQKTDFVYSLQKETEPNYWEDVAWVDADIVEDDARYRIDARFYVWGELRLSTSNPAQVGSFDFTPIDVATSDITGLYGTMTTSLTGTVYTEEPYNFQLWVKFFDDIYFAKGHTCIILKP